MNDYELLAEESICHEQLGAFDDMNYSRSRSHVCGCYK